jgi:hypothetical protein
MKGITVMPAQRSLFALNIWGLFVCLLLVGPPGKAFTVEGDISVEGYGSGGISTYVMRFPFKASSNGEDWWIEVHYGDRYFEVLGGDGERTCSIVTFSQSSLEESLGPERANIAIPQAYVIDSSLPYHSEGTTCIVWLAFCSSGYFNQDPKTMPAIWNMGFHDPVTHGLVIRDLSLFGGGLPKAFELVMSRSSFMKTKEHEFLSNRVPKREIKRAGRILPEDQVLARYWTAGATNIGALTFPTEFFLDLIDAKKAGNAQKIQSYRGTVRVVRDEQREAYLPDIAGNIYVRDYRFFSRPFQIDEISYVNTNHNWMAKTDPGLLELFEATKQSMGRPKVSERVRDFVPFALLIIFVALPILFYTLRRKTAVQP